MTNFSRVILPAVAALGLTVGCAAGVQMTKDQISANPGQMVFNGYGATVVDCYRCHNGDGKGTTMRGPDLTKRVRGHSDEELRVKIMKGPGMMPSYKGKLSDEELDQIIVWLRAEFGGK